VNRIADFQGLHRGKRLFILASGPSLGELDLAPLGRRLVMGLNRSFLSYPDSHYHCVFDLRLFEEFGDALRRARYLFTLEDRPFGIPLCLLGGEGFSFDLQQGVYSGSTIAYFALQLAVYMGFRQIFYLGLDLRNRGDQTHFFGSDFHSLNHDHTEFPKMRRSLALAARLLEPRGIEIYNCSPDSTLECFPKVSYQWALEQ